VPPCAYTGEAIARIAITRNKNVNLRIALLLANEFPVVGG
jgi:hypothetical protein